MAHKMAHNQIKPSRAGFRAFWRLTLVRPCPPIFKVEIFKVEVI